MTTCRSHGSFLSVDVTGCSKFEHQCRPTKPATKLDLKCYFQQRNNLWWLSSQRKFWPLVVCDQPSEYLLAVQKTMNVQYRKRPIASILIVVAMSVCGRAMTTTTVVPSYNFVGGQHARRWSKSESRLRETKEAGVQPVSPRPQVLSVTVSVLIVIISTLSLLIIVIIITVYQK